MISHKEYSCPKNILNCLFHCRFVALGFVVIVGLFHLRTVPLWSVLVIATYTAITWLYRERLVERLTESPYLLGLKLALITLLFLSVGPHKNPFYFYACTQSLLVGFLFRPTIAVSFTSVQGISLLLTSYMVGEQPDAYFRSTGLSFITLILLYFILTAVGGMLSSLATSNVEVEAAEFVVEADSATVEPSYPVAPPKERFAFNGLSKREAEVINLFMHGHTINGIASELNLSVSTVKTYIHRIYTKLEVSTKQEALVLLLEQSDEAG